MLFGQKVIRVEFVGEMAALQLHRKLRTCPTTAKQAVSDETKYCLLRNVYPLAARQADNLSPQGFSLQVKILVHDI